MLIIIGIIIVILLYKILDGQRKKQVEEELNKAKEENDKAKEELVKCVAEHMGAMAKCLNDQDKGKA